MVINQEFEVPQRFEKLFIKLIELDQNIAFENQLAYPRAAELQKWRHAMCELLLGMVDEIDPDFRHQKTYDK